MKFVKGERKKTETFHVKADNIPEVLQLFGSLLVLICCVLIWHLPKCSTFYFQADETFIFRLVSSGPQGKQGRVGSLTAFNVTILANDDANGIIVFLNTSLSIGKPTKLSS